MFCWYSKRVILPQWQIVIFYGVRYIFTFSSRPWVKKTLLIGRAFHRSRLHSLRHSHCNCDSCCYMYVYISWRHVGLNWGGLCPSTFKRGGWRPPCPPCSAATVSGHQHQVYRTLLKFASEVYYSRVGRFWSIAEPMQLNKQWSFRFRRITSEDQNIAEGRQLYSPFFPLFIDLCWDYVVPIYTKFPVFAKGFLFDRDWGTPSQHFIDLGDFGNQSSLCQWFLGRYWSYPWTECIQLTIPFNS